MSEQADAALQWAQANPQDPRAQSVMAKVWALKNPSDPRSAQIMQNLGGSSAPKPSAEQVYEQNKITPEDAQKYAGSISNALGGTVRGPAKALGRIGLGAVGGGLRGYFEGQGSQLDKLKNAGKDALFTGGVSALGEGAGAVLNKGADKLMQKAVGMRKYFPGVGNQLIDEGVYGTKNSMTNQVGEKLPQIESKLQETVQSLKGSAPASEISHTHSPQIDKFTNPDTGSAFPGTEPYRDQVNSRIESLNQLGSLSPQALLKLKRSGDWIARTSAGTVGSSLESEMANAEANAARSSLSKLSEGQSTTVPETLARERALILAKQALTKPETIHQGMGSAVFFGKYPGQALFGSLGAKGAQGLGETSQALSNPLLLQSLLGPISSEK